jgi:type I restriction enzyme S subunit
LSPPNHTTRQDAKSRVTRFGLSHEDIKSVRIPVPPGEEQAAIVKYLAHANARIDTAVAAKRRLIALLEEQKLATMAGLIGEMDGERMRLKRVASIQTGLTLGKDYRDQDLVEYPYLRVANVQMGHVDTTDLATVKVPVGEAGRCMLRRGDVLMTEGGDIDKLGRGTVWDGSVEPCLHQNHVFAVRCQDLLLPEYLAAWLATPEPRYYFYVTAKKTTNLAATNSTTVRELPIVLSAVEEQRALLARAADFAAPMVDAVTRTAREIALLQEFRVRLVADVVTGQVDVRGIATSLPEIDLTASWGDSASVEDADGADFDDVMEASED